MSDKLSFLVFGAGAVGSVYGWRIQVGGGNVSVVCRSNYEAVKKNGFTINSEIFGSHTFIPNNVYSSAKETVANGQEYDYILVCTKALPNIEDPTILLKQIIKSNKTTIVLVQNGIGIEEPYIKAVLEKDKEYKRRGEFALNTFDKILLSGKVESIVEKHLQRSRWFKLIWNASFNPISVISGQYSANDLLSNPGTRDLIKKTMYEVIKIGEAITGGPLHDEISGANIPDYYIDRIEIRNTIVVPSMLQDYMNKKPMEYEVILKTPIEKAKVLGIQVPILETLYSLLVMNEKRNLQ
ncbi:hypothetical protein BB558_002156 [Smittium angustum]|uniref:2-dehydropantoate 2-reductase n=1 Tax=Smittium angustum TaxID=133377 RepID=A0A2U1J9L9_SMIAN|nr:hypothetical protein BB558_002156 [Smittium angustum]